jgi:two-component system OmpR family response regulator
MAKVVLIDDDPSLHILLGQYLEQEGYTVFHAQDGQQGLRLIFEERVDIAVLDIMMPNMDGWTMLERIREMSEMPVILLTALNGEPEKLRGFRLGSDDYVTKPFSFAELAARIGTVLKRSGNQTDKPKVLTVGELMLDPTHHRVTLSGQTIELTPTEFRLLEALMSQPGRVFTKVQLVRLVWGDEYADEVSYIRNYIWHLRGKLEPDPDTPNYIQTVSGIGYKIEA